MSIEPQSYAWLIDDRLAVAERPGGGGRSHRIARRQSEFEWWRDRGVRHIVSGMRSRHGLVDAALFGFGVSWCPIADDHGADDDLRRLVSTAIGRLDQDAGAVLVHVDRPGEWLAAVDIRLRLSLGLASDMGEAMAQTDIDGFPVGDTTRRILGNPEVPAPSPR